MNVIVVAPLRRLSICSCGYGVLDDSIQVGVNYRLDLATEQRGYRYTCGRCGRTQYNLQVVNASQVLNPDMPFRPLPVALFCLESVNAGPKVTA